MSCSDGTAAGWAGAGMALGAMFGVESSFYKNPISDSTVTALQNQISENANKLNQAILDAKFSSDIAQIQQAEALLGEYKQSEKLVTQTLQDEISNSYVLIYGLIFSVFIMYLFLLFKK